MSFERIKSALTKSGTNQYSGSAYENFRNGSLAARDAFDRPSIATVSQFGGSFGGPLVKNRTFFFAGYQYDVSRSSGSASAAAPSAAGYATLNSLFPTGGYAHSDGLEAAAAAGTAGAGAGSATGGPRNTMLCRPGIGQVGLVMLAQVPSGTMRRKPVVQCTERCAPAR